MAIFVSIGEAYFALAIERRLWGRPPVLPEATALGVLSAQLRRLGASLTRRTLQPEATGAVMEVTKWLKPSV